MHGFLGRNDEVGMAVKGLDKCGAVVEACVQQKQIAFLEAVDELGNEFVFWRACLAADEAQGRTADQVKQAAELDSNRSQSLLTLECAETPPNG